MIQRSLYMTLNMGLFIFVLLYGNAFASNNLPDFTEMVEKYSPSVVNISSMKTTTYKSKDKRHQFKLPDLNSDHPLNELLERFLGDQFELPEFHNRGAKSLGSGFIISKDGYIITNHHVISSADEILVKLTDRREFKAKLIGSDKGSDIALIKIEAQDLPFVNIGKAASMKVGEWVLAIGSPFGFDHSVTAGIVSAKGRRLPNENYVPFIQTDVAINPGNSGGPLFNLRGEVIGVNSQIYSRSGGFMGLSFSIPIEIAMNVVDQLKNNGHVKRGYLGVLIQDVTHQLAESFNMKHPRGALVAKVLEDSPAAKAGLKEGDVILRFNGQEVKDSSQLPSLVGSSPINEDSKVEILREGKRKIFTVPLTKLPVKKSELASAAEPSKDSKEDRAGLIVKNLSALERKELGIVGNKGILVVKTKPGAGHLAGIKEGDIIIMINNQKISSVDDYSAALDKLQPGKNAAVLVHREDGALFLAMRLPLGK